MKEWTESDALAALAILPGVGPRSLDHIRQHYRSFVSAVVADREDLANHAAAASPGAGRGIRETGDLRAHLEHVRDQAGVAGARLVTRFDAGWPQRLADLSADELQSLPPASLFVRGRLDALESRFSVAIVGSRHPDTLARTQTRALARELAEAGVVVVSGGATGVDKEAHLAALAAGGETIVVQGTGIDVPYPKRHRGLFDEVVEAGGAVVSEMGPGIEAKPGLFPRRNRIVSGLADLVVVVAATGTSGSLITASHAVSQGRPVCAVPGDPRRGLSQGTNRLLVRGAAAVLEASDVIEYLFEIHGAARDGGLAADWLAGRRSQETDGALAVGPELPLTPRAHRVLQRLDTLPRGAEFLGHGTGLSGAEIAAALSELEMAGLAERAAGGYVLAGAVRAPDLEEGPGKR